MRVKCNCGRWMGVIKKIKFGKEKTYQCSNCGNTIRTYKQ